MGRPICRRPTRVERLATPPSTPWIRNNGFLSPMSRMRTREESAFTLAVSHLGGRLCEDPRLGVASWLILLMGWTACDLSRRPLSPLRRRQRGLKETSARVAASKGVAPEVIRHLSQKAAVGPGRLEQILHQF